MRPAFAARQMTRFGCRDSVLVHLVQETIGDPTDERGRAMKTTTSGRGVLRQILEREEAELVRVLRKRDAIVIEKSADQMDEIQCAPERDLAVRNVDRESRLLRNVRASLRRIHDGSFGTCTDCESAISPKRLAAVPWASRCIQCQDVADRNGLETTEYLSETLVNSA
jgi:DnaK suppressor protein